MEANRERKGKKKIAMKMIEDEDDRLITFSKRRSGIYKKTSELVTLCGAELGLVIFSPSGKPFSFGHPSADAAVDRFMGDRAPNAVESAAHPIVEAFRRRKVEEFNERHSSLADRLEDEKALRKALANKLNGLALASQRRLRNAAGEKDDEEEEEEEEEEEKQWWEAPLDGLDAKMLDARYQSLRNLHEKICSHVKERMVNANCSTFGCNAVAPPPLPPPQQAPNSPSYGGAGKGSSPAFGGAGNQQANQLHNWTGFPSPFPGHGNGNNNNVQY